MELDSESLDGKWAINPKNDIEFFIINDAIFSKLAILGTDVEPCFEGAEITAPKVSSSFTMDEDFTSTLFSMMKDLQSALNSSEGGLNMEKTVQDAEALETQEEVTPVAEEFENETEETAEAVAEVETPVEFEEEEETPSEDFAEKEEEDEDDKEKYSLLESENVELKEEIDTLKTEITELREFKMNIENEKKDALIESFYMLTEEDKQDVIENKANYSLEDIEAKLSVTIVRKGLSFKKDEEDTDVEEPSLTFNIDDKPEAVPAVIERLRAVKDND
jgi:hypothetical protein